MSCETLLQTPQTLRRDRYEKSVWLYWAEKEWTAEIEDENLQQFDDHQSGKCPDGAPPPSGHSLSRAMDMCDDSLSEDEDDKVDDDDGKPDGPAKPDKKKNPGTPAKLKAIEAEPH